MRKYCMLRCAHCTAGSQRAFMFSWRDRLAPNSAGTYGAGNETVGTRYHATSHVRARWTKLKLAANSQPRIPSRECQPRILNLRPKSPAANSSRRASRAFPVSRSDNIS